MNSDHASEAWNYIFTHTYIYMCVFVCVHVYVCEINHELLPGSSLHWRIFVKNNFQYVFEGICYQANTEYLEVLGEQD